MRAARRNATRVLFAFASLAAGTSCGGGGDLPTQPGGGGALVTQITITPDGGTIVAGQTLTLAAQPKDASGNAVSQSVTWSTSDPTVATVALGVVTALKPGTTAVTATNGVISKSVNVTVLPAIADVIVTPNPANIIITQTAQLTATPRDAAGTAIAGRTVTWSSGNDAIATVSAAGVVTAKTLGTTTITAAAEGKTGTATVVVSSIPVASVTVAPLVDPLVVGDSKQLTATTKDSIGGILGRSVTWTSSNPAIAAVGATTGVVSAAATGPVTITATSEGKTGTLDLVVRQVGSVTVTPATITVAAGRTTPLTAAVADANSQPLSGRVIAWTTTDAAIATVNASGIVTGVSAGTATISASNGGKTGQSSVSVFDFSAPTVVGLQIKPTSVDVSSATDSVELSAVVKDAGGSGVQRVEFTARTPDGKSASTCVTLVPATGTVADGTFKCHVIIPAKGPNGDWTLSVVAIDAAINRRSLTTADLVNLLLPSKFAVHSTLEDKTPPNLDSLTIAPLSVDVSSVSKVISVNAGLTDPASGAAHFDLRLTAPDGLTSVGCSADAPVPPGTRASGIWHCDVVMPARATPGDWRIAVAVADAAFNSQIIPLAPKITVVNTAPDPDAPVFTSLSIDPAIVNLSTGSKVLTVTAKLTDVGTGVDRFDFRAVAPDGTLAECSSTTPELGGTGQNGTWVCKVTIPPSVVGGDWQIFVQATDKALNARALGQAELTAAHFPTKVTVIAP